MDLNIALPKEYQKILKQQTEETQRYCGACDIDLDGNYTTDFYICVTNRELFIFKDHSFTKYELQSLEKVKNDNQVNCGILIATIDGEEILLAKYSMKNLSRFAYIARGIQLLIEKNETKQIVSTERERVCKICGRVLPGTMHCPKCDKEHRNLKHFYEICKPYKWPLLIVLIMMMIGTTLDLGQQFVFRYFIDGFLIPQTGTLLNIALFFLALLFVSVTSAVLYLVRYFICNRLGTSISLDLRSKLYNKIQELSLTFINKRHPGALIHRVSGDTDRIRTFMQDTFCDMFGQFVTLIALTVVMLILNWKLALAAFVFVPLIIVSARIFWPHVDRIYRKQWFKYDKINNKLQDVLSGIRVVKVFGKEKDETDKFTDLNIEYAHVETSNEKFFATFYPLLSFLLAAGSYLIVYLGGTDVLQGKMSPGELVQFVSYSSMLLGPLSWMSFLPRRIIQMTTSLERVYDVLDEVNDILEQPNTIQKPIEGNISLQNIVFGYKSFEPVIDGISLDVKKGEMIGIVGSSGSGKSTIINLIMRLYDVDDGSILVDGINIKDYDIRNYHKQLGVVLQETFLFSGTILNNIRFAKPDATMEDVIYAAKRANAHEFICKLPDGYNTYVGERGYTLSGGEKQRISIARAILNDPKILILDEATSALDTESEYQIQEAMERLRQGRTTFAIAHRLSTLRNADRIMVIDDHKCAEIGTHDELLRKKGIYYGLVMAQLQMSKTPVEK